MNINNINETLPPRAAWSGGFFNTVISLQEVFIRKCLSALVTGIGIGFSIIMISLVAHKGYVYSKKGLRS